MSDPTLPDGHRELITRVARSRIAAYIKYAGFCEAKNLVPLFPSAVYGNLTVRMLDNLRLVLAGDESDPLNLARSHVLDLCHNEFLVDSLLDALSIKEVLRLRTPAWRDYAVAREGLFSAAYEITKEAGAETDFEARITKKISEFRVFSDAVTRERRAIDYKTACIIKAGVLFGTPALSTLLQVTSPFQSIAVTLALGFAWVMMQEKDLGPARQAIKDKVFDMRRGAGFALHNFYSPLKIGS